MFYDVGIVTCDLNNSVRLEDPYEVLYLDQGLC